MLCEGSRDVNEFSSATHTYATLASTRLPVRGAVGPRGARRLGRTAQDEPLDRGEMRQHGAPCTACIPAPDRAQDAPVILVRAPRTAPGEQAFLTALAEQVHERADDPH